MDNLDCTTNTGTRITSIEWKSHWSLTRDRSPGEAKKWLVLLVLVVNYQCRPYVVGLSISRQWLCVPWSSVFCVVLQGWCSKRQETVQNAAFESGQEWDLGHYVSAVCGILGSGEQTRIESMAPS
jgi:hypothetical protein